MKKLLSIVIVFTLVLSMGAVAFADTEYLDSEKIEVTKQVILTNPGTVHPAESFTFTVGAGTVTGAAAGVTAPPFSPNTVTIDILEGGLLGAEDLDFPDFTAVGVYTYPITESLGNTAGFTYNQGPNNLKITVINDGEGDFKRVLTLTAYDDQQNPIKLDAFRNDFSAGNLVISKEITGNYGVFSDEFDVTVTLTPDDGKNIKEGPITVSGAVGGIGSVSEPDSITGVVTVTFTVTHGSTVTIANIPYGVSYAVTEASGDYTASYSNGLEDENEVTTGNGSINAATQNVEITNNLDIQIETGINLDNLPYILILVGAAVGLVGFTFKRRLSNDK